MKLGILQKFFSIVNDDSNNIKEKVITILGFEYRCERKEKSYVIENLYCRLLHKFLKIKENKIVFLNGCTGQYACNIKYIAEEFLKTNISEMDLVWITNNNTDSSLIPKEFRKVSYNTIDAIKELMSARIWVLNSHPFLLLKKGLKKPKETIVIQTWHGSMGIKKESADAGSNAYQNQQWFKWQQLSASYFDYLIADSNMEESIFKSAFWGNGEVLKFGKARASIFFKDQKPIIDKVKEYYDIPKENKILLYAPTWRTNKRFCCFNIDIKLLKKTLNKKFGGNWTVLIRSHYLMPKKIFNALYDKDEIINCTNYTDMQELLVASDVLISDYSSCIPEYVILKKPSFVYATDIETYENGFYYPLSTLPSPIATDNGELEKCILDFNQEDFSKKAEEFLIQMGYCDDGKACERIVNFILEKMENK